MKLVFFFFTSKAFVCSIGPIFVEKCDTPCIKLCKTCGHVADSYYLCRVLFNSKKTDMATTRLKNRYVEILGIIIMVLALVRCIFPGVAGTRRQPVACEVIKGAEVSEVMSHVGDGEVRHRIYSVPSYRAAFPDSNSVQLEAAQRWGVQPVRDRTDAEQRKSELVYIGSSPYYHVDPLTASIPYLVPRASVLLQDIGQAFFDSLHVKGVPLHRFIVTSVLRSEADVERLRRYNSNATERSCHLYGTTFDICYNRYQTVEDPDGPPRREVRNDTLKFVLSEVLRDMREAGRCYVKYEVKQGCFHMTVR